MHKKIFFLLILFSCNKNLEPKEIIGKEKMINTMIDIHVLESKISHSGIYPRDSTQKVYERYEQLIFEKYGIDTDYFQKSFIYYNNHPKLFDEIYTAVMDSLMLKKSISSSQ